MKRDVNRDNEAIGQMVAAMKELGRDAMMSDLVRITGMTRMRCLRLIELCISDGTVVCGQRRGRKTYAVRGQKPDV